MKITDFQVNPFKELKPEYLKKQEEKDRLRKLCVSSLLQLMRKHPNAKWRMSELQEEVEKIHPKIGFADMLACMGYLVETRKVSRTPATNGRYNFYRIIS